MFSPCCLLIFSWIQINSRLPTLIAQLFLWSRKRTRNIWIVLWSSFIFLRAIPFPVLLLCLYLLTPLLFVLWVNLQHKMHCASWLLVSSLLSARLIPILLLLLLSLLKFKFNSKVPVQVLSFSSSSLYSAVLSPFFCLDVPFCCRTVPVWQRGHLAGVARETDCCRGEKQSKIVCVFGFWNKAGWIPTLWLDVESYDRYVACWLSISTSTEVHSKVNLCQIKMSQAWELDVCFCVYYIHEWKLRCFDLPWILFRMHAHPVSNCLLSALFGTLCKIFILCWSAMIVMVSAFWIELLALSRSLFDCIYFLIACTLTVN